MSKTYAVVAAMKIGCISGVQAAPSISVPGRFAKYGVSLYSLVLYLGTFSSTAGLVGLTRMASRGLGPATDALAIDGVPSGDVRYTAIVPSAFVLEPETCGMLLAALSTWESVAGRKSKIRTCRVNARAISRSVRAVLETSQIGPMHTAPRMPLPTRSAVLASRGTRLRRRAVEAQGQRPDDRSTQ